jgi:predicted secreted protein
MGYLLVLFVCLSVITRSERINVDQTSDVELSLSSTSPTELQVKSNPTTGYFWYLIIPSDSKIQTTDPQGEYFPPESNVFGASGYQVFQIYCRNSCYKGYSDQIRLVYLRPSEKLPIQTKTLSITVIN